MLCSCLKANLLLNGQPGGQTNCAAYGPNLRPCCSCTKKKTTNHDCNAKAARQQQRFQQGHVEACSGLHKLQHLLHDSEVEALIRRRRRHHFPPPSLPLSWAGPFSEQALHRHHHRHRHRRRSALCRCLPPWRHLLLPSSPR